MNTLRNRRGVRMLMLAVLAVGMMLSLGAGQSSSTRFNRLGHNLMCMCGCNQILLECNHVGCSYSERMRKELQAAIDSGQSDQVVLQGFVRKYGNTVLAAPTTTGFNRVAWIMPGAILLLALGTVVFVVRTWKRRQPASAGIAPTLPEGSPEADDYRRRAREETEL